MGPGRRGHQDGLPLRPLHCQPRPSPDQGVWLPRETNNSAKIITAREEKEGNTSSRQTLGRGDRVWAPNDRISGLSDGLECQRGDQAGSGPVGGVR